jgi:hypothetical protein
MSEPWDKYWLNADEARAIMAYIESLEKPWGLDMWRKYGLGADHASANQAALFTQQHPSVGSALKKLKEVGDGK